MRAKNTSRQRAHLLDCQPYLNAMKEHHPDNPILQEAINGPPAQPPPSSSGPGVPHHPSTPGGPPSVATGTVTPHSTANHHHHPKPHNKKRDYDSMANSGFQGDSLAAVRNFPIPKPMLERDFQMSVQLNPKISVGPGIWGQRSWTGFISGHWNGRWGKGTIVVRFFSHNTSVNHADPVHSPAVEILNSSLPTSPPTSTRPTFSLRMTTHLPTSR